VDQKAVELILVRQLASYLATPIFVVDGAGTLLFYNEPAEAILGLRYDETGEMPVDEWSTRFTPTDDEDQPLPPERLPLVQTMGSRMPAHGSFWITGADGHRRRLSVTALPIIGQSARDLGSIALFWEEPKR
jgi:PAS domain-containing protein